MQKRLKEVPFYTDTFYCDGNETKCRGKPIKNQILPPIRITQYWLRNGLELLHFRKSDFLPAHF